MVYAAEPSAASDTRGAGRMAARLDTIVQQANPQLQYTVGHDDRVARLQLQLSRASNLAQESLARITLAYEHLKEGHSAKAIDLLLQVRRDWHQQRAQVNTRTRHQLARLLATAYLRLGEQENCLARHGPDSCLMPIRGGGVHTRPEGSRKAIAELSTILGEDSTDLVALWLINLAYMTLGEYPQGVPSQWRIEPDVFKSDPLVSRFQNVATDLGIDAVGLGGGVVMEDFDRDGDLDLMTSSWGLLDQMQFFRNDGQSAFAERTAQAGLSGLTGGINLCQADYNNDGYADVLVLRGAWLLEGGLHPNSLLRNNADGTFSDVTESAGLLGLHPTHAAAWADFDGDGWVDVFVGNESKGASVHPCQLFRNNGDGTFTDVARGCGLDHVGFVKGVAWGDFDNDGRPDLFLSRLLQTNLLFRNLGKVNGAWRFADVTAQAGVGRHIQSFPTWFWDFDNDGWQDIFVAPFQGFTSDSLARVAADYLGRIEPTFVPAVYRNRGNGTFEDVTASMGLRHNMLVMGANFGDIDNDGWLDLYLGTGEPTLHTLVPNRMYRNDGGRGFQDVTFSAGFGHLQKGHGIAFGDLDNDGDQDVYAVMGGAYTGDVAYNAMFLNPGLQGRWITLQLEGQTSNRLAMGARICVCVRTASGSRDIHVTVGSGGSFGASSLQQEIGLGEALAIERVIVRWPGQTTEQILTGLSLDAVYRIHQGRPVAERLDRTRISMPQRVH